ncbi:MAG: ankyrin repeat domain-containing protein [Luteitalea sp.]|nr:ankyrin repeat domain-containing protein [Luteitalea sp.]
MLSIRTGERLAVAVVEAIHTGDVQALKRLLAENPGLATARMGGDHVDDACVGGTMSRTLLHVATDWPGHFPNGAATVVTLVEAGADVNARFVGPHTETPLHWAASSNDVEVLDALLDAGADIEAPGAVIAGGTPLADAVAFGQWEAARRLVARGATTPLREAAALGLMERVERHWAGDDPPTPDQTTHACWYACHGGQQRAAQYLLERGADLNWVSTWDRLTPLDAARRSGHDQLVEWLRGQGGKSASELHQGLVRDES